MKLKWSRKYKKVKVNKFTESIGPTETLPSNPLKMFLLFFTEELIRMIVDQSNLFASLSMSEEQYSKWNKISSEELQAYLGFIIIMGLVPLPSIYDYWSTNKVFHYSPIAEKISRDRFLAIHKYLHFVDNSTLSPYDSNNYDKLGRIRPISDVFLR